MNKLDQLKQLAKNTDIKTLAKVYAELSIINQHVAVMSKYIHTMCQETNINKA